MWLSARQFKICVCVFEHIPKLKWEHELEIRSEIM